MTQTIEQLRARIAELEAEVERLSAAHVKACQANADSQAELAAAQEEILIERSNGDHWRDAYSKWVNTDESARRLIELQEQLAKAEQRVAEACALTYLEDYDLTDIADRVRAGEWRKFVKEV